MAAIDKDLLLEDIKFYLPSSNILTDANIIKIYTIVINDVGDDDSIYSEVVCKSLRRCAEKNKRDIAGSQGALKSQKVGPLSEAFYQGSVVQVWKEYLKDLSNLCAFELDYVDTNYAELNRIEIAPGDEIDVNITSSGTGTTSYNLFL